MPAVVNFEIDILRRIVDVAKDIQQATSGATVTANSVQPPIQLNRFKIDWSFPQPQPITSDILALGINAATADSMSDAYLRAARELEEKYECHLRGLCNDLAQNHSFADSQAASQMFGRLRSAFVSRYEQMLQTWADENKAMCRERVLKLKGQGGNADTRSRTSFNHV
ncbi:hypothetical protein PILCRDRAFT_830421, partial [Piloderma croceum F 1598]